MDFFRRAAQVVGSLTQLAANMRECAVYAEQFAQMINGIPWWIPPAYIDPERKPLRNTRIDLHGPGTP